MNVYSVVSSCLISLCWHKKWELVYIVGMEFIDHIVYMNYNAQM